MTVACEWRVCQSTAASTYVWLTHISLKYRIHTHNLHLDRLTFVLTQTFSLRQTLFYFLSLFPGSPQSSESLHAELSRFVLTEGSGALSLSLSLSLSPPFSLSLSLSLFFSFLFHICFKECSRFKVCIRKVHKNMFQCTVLIWRNYLYWFWFWLRIDFISKFNGKCTGNFLPGHYLFFYRFFFSYSIYIKCYNLNI